MNMALNPELFLRSLNDGVYAVDTDRRIAYWGPSAERITGWREVEIMGKRCSVDVLNHVDKDGRPLCSGELHLDRLDLDTERLELQCC